METRQQPCVASSVINGIKADGKRPDGSLCTKDGSLDRYGRPAIKGRTGGWRCAMFILVNQGLVTLAFAAVEAANTFSRWMGTMYLFSLMGAFLSDSYLGRYLTCVSFQVLYLIGLIALSLVTQLSLLKPQGCGKLGQLCEPHSSAETVVFYFDEEDNTEKQSKISFYSYFYVALNMGSLVVETVLVYIQNLGNWILGFWICAACAALAFCLLLWLYEVERKQGKNNGVRRILHTNGFKYLDRASIITLVDVVKPANPWHLCTITQVEVKSIVKLLPIWFCTVLSSVVMFAFDIISTSTFILLYDKLIVPLYIKVTKREPKPPSELQRIGIGIAMAMASMIIAVIVEQQRLKHADSKNTRGLSIFWQIPQYVLVGVSEAFVYVAQMEFFATQTPDGLKSLGIGLSMSSSAMVSYICSIILTTVMAITSTNGEAGWVPPDLNDGHLDRYFFLLAALTAINLVLFVICAKR
uniref:Uncharacterized protein n=1 Tax=Gossypium raimondii TaxID=29730 RepID=A0A0D2MZ67_GOSRA|nr:hypothetical protein B456_004G163000 [Gossypium raimondii]